MIIFVHQKTHQQSLTMLTCETAGTHVSRYRLDWLTERRRLTAPPAGELRGEAQRELLLHVLRLVLLGALLPSVLPFLHACIKKSQILSMTAQRPAACR